MQRLAVHKLISCRVYQETEMSEKIHSYDGKLNCRQQKGPVEQLTPKREAKMSFSPARNRLASRPRKGWATRRAGGRVRKNGVGGTGIY
jgi:hypothetical protein